MVIVDVNSDSRDCAIDHYDIKCHLYRLFLCRPCDRENNGLRGPLNMSTS